MEKEQARQKISELVERFTLNLASYKNGAYNETQVRREFIDPFFDALGWDVANRRGYAEQYKDVVHEDSIKVGVSLKAPDYSFRIGGQRKFFLEAKKPSVSIKEDESPAYQLRRYAWSAKLPLSILTDFEELAVYDCRSKPDIKDKVSTGRIAYYTYDKYIEKFDEIYGTFSKDAVLKGSFDRYAESTKVKKGTAEVDSAFLKEIESWRDALARNIALRNQSLTVDELNFAIQNTIDRIIFLRICEDRGIEQYGRLQSHLNGVNVYGRLLDLFYEADKKYNSGLFDFKADTLSPSLSIDDKTLKAIIEGLYYPASPYEFSVIGADILGNVYEQFLGKVIRLTSGHQAKVEEKPEVKKAGGVYYTPQYIVEYIVKNTVGKALEGKSPKQAEKIWILDPACGSGSFLIGAYQYLLDWHLKWYTENDPEKHARGKTPAVYHGKGGWKLATSEKKRILLNNIYGVDIDRQAVEVTKLSLLLKVLEDESQETIGKSLALFHERVLPSLEQNIRCGNSLIGPDFYSQTELALEDDEARRINVFDWNDDKRGFGKIMKEGGFDCVIGNPPYGYMIPKLEQEYFMKFYCNQDYQKDLYLLFLERYSFLIKTDGLLGIIVSNTWLQSITLRKIRFFLTNQYKWHRILVLPEKVFKATVDTHVLIFEKIKNVIQANNGTLYVDIKNKDTITTLNKIALNEIPKSGEIINIIASSDSQKIFKKIYNKSLRLNSICNVFNGIKPFEINKGNPPQTKQTMQDKPFVCEGNPPDKTWTPLLRGSLIQRYKNLWAGNYWVKYGPWLAAPRDPAIFSAPLKIMVRQTGDSIIATTINSDFVARNNLHIIILKNNSFSYSFLLGILNSKLMDFVYSIINPEKGEALAEVKKAHVEQLPIKAINTQDKHEKSQHDKMISLVDRMLDLNKKLKDAKTPHDKDLIERQVEATDRQIDALVYELYGLTEDEIKIVEEAW